ncbi:hypothetical protein [Falsiroseomonas sp. CW058]|uniref:hypothetical protein n=1 Tax=Falsiroseomonas sp. CW058 TaxID=3388664 RepID=UPI003D3111F2
MSYIDTNGAQPAAAHITERPIRGLEDIPVYASDLTLLRGIVTAAHPGIASIHRDADGWRTGEETTRGEKKNFFTRGGRRGLVWSPITAATRRLVIAPGPLPMVCIAALERETAVAAVTAYATPGGVWTEAAAEAAERRIAEIRIPLVIVACTGLLAKRIMADLPERVANLNTDVVHVEPPPDGWVAELRRRRAGHPVRI